MKLKTLPPRLKPVPSRLKPAPSRRASRTLGGQYVDAYAHRAWRERAAQHLRRHPICVMCEANGRVEAATVADHIVPHRGNAHEFWHGQLQSLCASCHSSTKQRAEIAADREPGGPL